MSQQHQYGQTFEEVARVGRPTRAATSWGAELLLSNRPEFCLFLNHLAAGKVKPLSLYRNRPVTYYLSQGTLVLRWRERDGRLRAGLVEAGQCLPIAAGVPHSFHARSDAMLYGFTNQLDQSEVLALETAPEAEAAGHALASLNDLAAIGQKTIDFRDKYWGTIETIVSSDIAGKKIFMKSGAQSSLEYHVLKAEAYYVESGKIRVGLRVGRGENRSVDVSRGETFEVLPGTMHMRIGIEDSIVLEVSTRDQDSDSHIVADGQTYRHEE